METVGERIKRRRLELQMSQDELAQKLGYSSRSSINKIELGYQNLKQSKILEIANALETTTDYIMGWEKDEQNSALIPESKKVKLNKIIKLMSQLTEDEMDYAMQILEVTIFKRKE